MSCGPARRLQVKHSSTHPPSCRNICIFTLLSPRPRYPPCTNPRMAARSWFQGLRTAGRACNYLSSILGIVSGGV